MLVGGYRCRQSRDLIVLLQVNNLAINFPSRGRWGFSGAQLNCIMDVSFSVPAGQTFALVGESGSGKTTLLRAIAGLIPVSSGSVQFNGKELVGLSAANFRPLRRDIAVMFQDPVGSLSPRCTVQSLLAEPFVINGMRGRDLHGEVKRLLGLVGLPADFATRHPHQLSGGQARRVGIARALALSPKLILADEPTAGLDVSIQGEVLNLFNDLQDKLGLAMVLITHNLNIVRHVAARVGVLYLGRLVEEGATDALFLQPRHPYTKCLLSANPSLSAATDGERIKVKGESPGIASRPSGCEFRGRCPFAEEPLCLQTPPWQANDDRGCRCLKPLL